MWILILETLLVSGASNGGVATTTTFFDFPNEAKCRAAADAMGVTQEVALKPLGGGARSDIPTGRLSGQCSMRRTLTAFWRVAKWHKPPQIVARIIGSGSTHNLIIRPKPAGRRRMGR
jgi:hypothetical protein